MKKLTLKDLSPKSGHIFEDFLPGEKLYEGGLSFSKPNEISHMDDCENGIHTHSDCELFLIVQGRAVIDVDGEKTTVKTGDIILVEPDEDHHVISDGEDPALVLWCHAR